MSLGVYSEKLINIEIAEEIKNFKKNFFSEQDPKELKDFKNGFFSKDDPTFQAHHTQLFLDVLRYQYQKDALSGMTLLWMLTLDATITKNFDTLNAIWDKFQDKLTIEDFKKAPTNGPYKNQTMLTLISIYSTKASRDFFHKVYKHFKHQKKKNDPSLTSHSSHNSNATPPPYFPPPVAGIHNKYLGGALPSLPYAPSTQSLPQTAYSNEQVFIELNRIPRSQNFIRKRHRIKSSFFKGFFYTTRSRISSQERVSFVCAGRTSKALIPQTEQDRCVLVLTEDEYKKLSAILPAWVDALVVKKLRSKTHGIYTNLGAITCRRIAIFLFAYALNLKKFMMLDDNIKIVKFNPSQAANNQYSQFYDFIASQLNDLACVSVQTQTYKDKPYLPNKLGSKLFMINMQKIKFALHNIEETFLLFPDAAHEQSWGEDLYFQIMFYAMFGPTSFRNLDLNLVCLNRSAKNRNAYRKKGKDATFYQYYDPTFRPLPDYQLRWLHNTVSRLNKIISDNYNRRQQEIQTHEEVDLLARHASANHIPKSNVTLPNTALALQGGFVRNLKANLARAVLDPQQFRYYQVETVKRVAYSPYNHGTVVLGTGCGKSTVIARVVEEAFPLLQPGEYALVSAPSVEVVIQLYKSFLKYIEEKAKHPIPPHAIITICSNAQSCSISEILINKTFTTQKAIVFICDRSLNILLDEATHLLGKIRSISVDEPQETPGTVKKLIGMKSRLPDCLMLSFTATPLEPDPFEHRIYTYSTEQGVKDDFLPSLIVDDLGANYSLENVEKLTQCLPVILRNQHHPRFMNKTTLSTAKGIIFAPSIAACEKMREVLNLHQISAIAIHSKNPNRKNELKTFIESEEPCVLILYKMLKNGFDHNQLGWIIMAQDIKKDNPQHLISAAQGMGRLERSCGDKIGYVLGFRDAVQNVLAPLAKGKIISSTLSASYLGDRRSYYLGEEKVFEIIPELAKPFLLQLPTNNQLSHHSNYFLVIALHQCHRKFKDKYSLIMLRQDLYRCTRNTKYVFNVSLFLDASFRWYDRFLLCHPGILRSKISGIQVCYPRNK